MSLGQRRVALAATLLAASAATVGAERTGTDRNSIGQSPITAIDTGSATGSETGPDTASNAALGTRPGLGVPTGSVMAFVPNMTGGDYGTTSQLRAWLARQGWAICDGTRGTPDLRNRMLLGTTDASTVGQRIGAWEHDHRVRGETGIPVRRNRNTPTGRLQNQQIPNDQHRHRVDMKADKAEHLPPSMRVLFIMKVR
jgi:hypothetical protein